MGKLIILESFSLFVLDIIKYSVYCPTANYHVFVVSCSKYEFFRCHVANTTNFECLIANFALGIPEAV